MVPMVDLQIWFILLTNVEFIKGISYNQPKLCPNASWNPNASTFADNSIIGWVPHAIFVNTNNTVIAASHSSGQLLIWRNADLNALTTISSNLTNPFSVFVTEAEEIFVNTRDTSHKLERWTFNGAKLPTTTLIFSTCSSLFVDVNNNLYCSQHDMHQVVKISSNNQSESLIIVAGTGSPGSASYMINFAFGIFVAINFDLYVADSGNDRIQLFRAGERNGTTVAGNGGTNNITLRNPTGVVVDADGYLFIVEHLNHRIVRSGPSGFHFVVAGTGSNSSAPNELYNPVTLSFDRDGNIYVTDRDNHRIQKFQLLDNSCNASVTSTASSILSVANSTHTNTYPGNVRSFNEPKLCYNATWNPNAITFASGSIIGSVPRSIFVNTNNTVVSVHQDTGQILIWNHGSINLTASIRANMSSPGSVFVTSASEIFVAYGNDSSQVDRWTFNGTRLSTPMSMLSGSPCFGLFVDVANTLYCSQNSLHRVVKTSLTDPSGALIIAAGVASNGSASYMLTYPNGIFVTENFDLYVTDSGNDRIKMFRAGERNGTVVAGDGAPGTINLTHPTGIVVDADKCLFIVDYGGHRIIRSGPSGLRCVVGCSGSSGSGVDQLASPRTLTFDTDGNMFVLDQGNNRIQKFLLIENSCDTATTSGPALLTSTIEPGEISSTDRVQSSESPKISFPTSNPMTLHVPISFVSQNCSNKTTLGMYCNLSAQPCDMLDPCQNSGTCKNTEMTVLGYVCFCAPGFNGTQCQLDYRPCQSNPCWNGVCNVVWDYAFYCNCSDGWEGKNCEKKVNYCQNITCQNNGVCRPVLDDYQCECLGNSYSGRLCEKTSQAMAVYNAVSKSLGYVGILALVSTATLIVVMDLLKYAFGIDPVREERDRLEREKQGKRRKQPVIQRFVYVHKPSTPPPTNQPISGRQETNV